MGRYILRRILTLIPILFVVSAAVFFILRMAKGDPAMAEDSPVLLSIDARGIATATLNRPQFGNAYNAAKNNFIKNFPTLQRLK